MYIGAFDIGGTKTIIALADENGRFYEKEQFVTDTTDCFRHLDHCIEVFLGFLRKQNITPDQVEGVGVNLPGIVERKEGILLRAVYADWNNIPAGAYLAKKLGISRIVCENDVNSCAEAELMFGLGKEYKNFAWMTVSTGVGGAVVCDGRLIRGAHGYAGEFGHLKVEYEHPQTCPCGDQGCLEAQGSGTAIARRTAEAFKDAGRIPSGAECAQMAREGNADAISVYEEAGEYIGRGICSYVNILDPEVIVIGGGVAAALDLMEPAIYRAIERYAFPAMKQVKVKATALGYEAALMGAVAIVISNRKAG